MRTIIIVVVVAAVVGFYLYSRSPGQPATAPGQLPPGTLPPQPLSVPGPMVETRTGRNHF